MAAMTQVQIEVESGASRLRVSVRAANIERALRLVGERNPGASVRVVPTEPGTPSIPGAECERTLGTGTTGGAA